MKQKQPSRDWNVELRTVHNRLVANLEAARVALGRGQRAAILSQDLRIPCFAFCSGLTKHHQGEDAGLFPRLAEEEPELRPVIAELMDAHLVITTRLAELRRTLEDESSTPEAILDRLNAIKAFMKSHFGDEERRLARALRTLRDDESKPADLLGQVPAPESDLSG